jgi:AraC-like DNA-binding protein
LAILPRSPQLPFPFHQHEFTELVIVFDGRGIHLAGDEEYPLSAGDVFVLTEGMGHGFANLDHLSLVNVLLQPARLALPYEELRKLSGFHALFLLEPQSRTLDTLHSRLTIGPEALIQCGALLQRLDAELHAETPGYQAIALALLTELFVLLARAYARRITPVSQATLRLGEVLGMMHSRYAEALTIEELAGSAHLSSSQFTRLFQQATGVTPMRYLIRYRLQKAAELLRGTRGKITEIAQMVGYTDSNYFSRRFNAQMGSSPRAYRKKE